MLKKDTTGVAVAEYLKIAISCSCIVNLEARHLYSFGVIEFKIEGLRSMSMFRNRGYHKRPLKT